ncbi:MAG TPA: hypothetical protein DIW24_10180 [Bacteroidetes bacterium]|nr:hypothetical protein [Bacteroidota bacterium]
MVLYDSARLQLWELEGDGLIVRKIYAEVPLRVAYSITSYGETLFPLINAMSAFGLTDVANKASTISLIVSE